MEYRVCAGYELAERECRVVRTAEREIGVFRAGGRFYAYLNRCPHRGGPVCRGQVLGAPAATRVAARLSDPAALSAAAGEAASDGVVAIAGGGRGPAAGPVVAPAAGPAVEAGAGPTVALPPTLTAAAAAAGPTAAVQPTAGVASVGPDQEPALLLVCPWHGWTYDLTSGACPTDRSMRLKSFPAFVRAGDVFVDA